MQPQTAVLCEVCVHLIPNKVTTQAVSTSLGSFVSLASRAKSCLLCELIQSDRQAYIDRIHGKYPDIDEATIDCMLLTARADPCEASNEGLAWTTLQVYLLAREYQFPRYYFVLACSREARCAGAPIWKSFPTTYDDKLKIMQNWLRNCRSNHPNCVSEDKDLPRRLLHVPRGHESDLRLVNSEDIKSSTVEYACLSYCWGGTVPIRTTKKNRADFHDRILYKHLPQTFKDAVAIVQTLQISYLWIDALCIIQDESDDWEAEAARMQDIYSGSTLTIAASSAENSFGGFFGSQDLQHSRPNRPNERTFLAITKSESDAATLVQIIARGNMYSGPKPVLGTRGWTLQEEVLSHRVISCIHSELCWRCRYGCQTESGLELDPSRRSVWNSPSPNLNEIRDPSRIWWEWVQDYSGRKLTFPNDKLPALIGLIRHYEEATRRSSCLGMWKESLHQDLAWRRRSQSLATEPIEAVNATQYPSWTWLRCAGEVEFDPTNHRLSQHGRTEMIDHVEVLAIDVSWKGTAFTSELASTRLVVRGPMREIFIEIAPRGRRFNPPYCHVHQEVLDASESQPLPWRCTVQFDHEAYRPGTDWMCLLLRTRAHKADFTRNRYDTFLILEPVQPDLEPPTYRRVGLGVLRHDEQTFKATVLRTIQLV